MGKFTRKKYAIHFYFLKNMKISIKLIVKANKKIVVQVVHDQNVVDKKCDCQCIGK